MKTRTIKANMVLRGMTILGLGAVLFGATAMTPARADNRDRGRDHGGLVLNIGVRDGHVNSDFVIYNGPDHRPDGRDWRWDSHDRCWRRDRGR